MDKHLPHILLPTEPAVHRYKPKSAVVKRKLPNRPDPGSHQQRLQTQFTNARRALSKRDEERRTLGISTGRGSYLQFDSSANFKLHLGRLADNKDMEILTVQSRSDGGESITIRIPESRHNAFATLLDSYTRPSGPKADKDLVTSIEDIRVALLESFWTDPLDCLPAPGATFTWEVWLRQQDTDFPAADSFRREAEKFGVRVLHSSLQFPDRCVVLAYGTLEQMSGCATLLNNVGQIMVEAPSRRFGIA